MKKLFLSFLAIFLIIEEWLWDVLTALGRRLSRLLHLEKWEEWLRVSPPHIALLAFLVPVIVVTPINLFAFWMIAQGIIIRGIVLEIFAKILGTVLIARVFALTKPQLMTYRWFSVLYTTITGWLRWAHERVKQTSVYKAAQKLKASIKAIEWPWKRK